MTLNNVSDKQPRPPPARQCGAKQFLKDERRSYMLLDLLYLQTALFVRDMACSLRRGLKNFIDDEDAIGTVEMILILIVLIGLVIIFRNQLKTIVNDLFDKVTTQSNSV